MKQNPSSTLIVASLLAATLSSQAAITLEATQSNYSTAAEAGISESFDMLGGNDLVLVVTWRTGTGTYSSTSSVTFGGEAPDASYIRGWPDRVEADIYVWKDLGTTSATIDVSFSTDSTWGYAAYSLNNLASATAYDNDEWYDGSGTAITRTYNGVAGGIVISGMSDEDYLATTATITSSTGDVDANILAVQGSDTTNYNGRFSAYGLLDTTGVDNVSYSYDYTRGAAGQTVVLEGLAVPEPSAALLGGLGLLGLLRRRRK